MGNIYSKDFAIIAFLYSLFYCVFIFLNFFSTYIFSCIVPLPENFALEMFMTLLFPTIWWFELIFFVLLFHQMFLLTCLSSRTEPGEVIFMPHIAQEVKDLTTSSFSKVSVLLGVLFSGSRIAFSFSIQCQFN